jgi:SAM-dependent methyltransferase
MKNTFLSVKGSPDYLWLHIRDLPYFRALLRSIEARFYQDMDLPRPVLDLGCGDGHFSSVAFDHPLDVGLDPWERSLQDASRRGSYHFLLQAQGGKIPLADKSFASVVSNSVLEHIPELQPVLLEVARVLKPGAPFIFCVPNHNFLSSLSIGKMLDSIGLDVLGNVYRDFFNHISRHHHCDSPDVWNKRLEIAGFEIERWWHYFSPQKLKVMEWGHYFGLPSLLIRWISGRWILLPTRGNLVITNRMLRHHFESDSVCANGVYTFYITRKV